jgi:hypothetical protein
VCDISSKHIEQFRLVNELCDDGRWLGFITLQPAELLEEWLSGFVRHCDLHAYTLEDFAEIAARRPTTKIA